MYDHERVERISLDKPYSSCYPIRSNLSGAWDQARDYLKARGLNYMTAFDNGWYPSQDAGDSALRLVIPGYSRIKRNCYWQARAIDGNKIRYQSPHGVRRGDAIVVVWPSSIPKKWVIAEGPMDALAAAEVGFGGVGLMGASPPLEALQTARRVVGNTPVSVVSDEGALEAATALWGHFSGASLVTTYPHKDLAEVPVGERKGLLS